MEFLILSSITLILAPFIYYLVLIPFRNLKRFQGIPSPKTVPILGNAIEMWRAQYEFNKVLDRWASLYGTRLAVWGTFWFPMVILGNAKDAKKVLCSREHVEKGLFYKAFDLPIGTGAFNSPVPVWKQRRPHLEQAFHSKVLSRLPKIFDSCSRLLVKVLKEKVADGKVFNVHPYLNLCSIQMLVEGAMGVKVDPMENRHSAYWKKAIDIYHRGTYIAEYRMLRPWYLISDFLWELTSYAKDLREVVNWSNENFYKQVLRERREVYHNRHLHSCNNNVNDIQPLEKKEKSYPNFMDLLLELQDTKEELNLSDQDVLHELSSVYIAGHDASGKSMSFAILYLGFYKECQEQVIKELDEIFGTDIEREITEEDLGKMKYLECCIKEALRLMPPVSFITRRVGSDLTLDDTATIPKGTEVAIATYLVHRDPEIYPQPETFRPERFLPENSQGRDPYSWIPFSAGPRNCLGPKFAMMEVKIVLANIFRNYWVESVGSVDNWVLNTNVTLTLEGGWNIKLFSRG